MTVMERKRLIENTEVLCAELERDDRDLGEILFPQDKEVSSCNSPHTSPGERCSASTVAA